MKQNPISSKINLIHSDIRGEIYLEALRMESAGTPVLKLNTGNPAAFGFSMPPSIRRALAEEAESLTPYSDLRGSLKARKAIQAYHLEKNLSHFDLEDIFLTNGVSEAVQIFTQAILDSSDEILLPTPNYSLWENCSVLAGATPVFYPCREENAWQPDPDEIEKKITPRTKALLLINPNNPTGAVYPEETLKRIVALARKHNLILFSDEIYDRLVLDGDTPPSTAALAPDLITVTFNGLSKSHIICGIRSGWATITGPKEKRLLLRNAVTQLCAMRLCSNTPSQIAVCAALNDPNSTKAMLVPGGRLYEQRKTTCEVLRKIDGIDFVENKAAFYLFPRLDREKFRITDDRVFAMDLLRAKHLLVVPGSGFHWDGNDHFRIVMLPEKEVLKKAMEDLGDFLSDYHQNP